MEAFSIHGTMHPVTTHGSLNYAWNHDTVAKYERMHPVITHGVPYTMLGTMHPVATYGSLHIA